MRVRASSMLPIAGGRVLCAAVVDVAGGEQRLLLATGAAADPELRTLERARLNIPAGMIDPLRNALEHLSEASS